jgi:hypothetical protein
MHITIKILFIALSLSVYNSLISMQKTTATDIARIITKIAYNGEKNNEIRLLGKWLTRQRFENPEIGARNKIVEEIRNTLKQNAMLSDNIHTQQIIPLILKEITELIQQHFHKPDPIFSGGGYSEEYFVRDARNTYTTFNLAYALCLSCSMG